ncbi:hypothetical protein EVAR_50124_1 [Eumeta japonica]|uniref:Uncharacterized protein n=1 Tax=Eumeta variegata TaxID=151549 RepID=A0A4C1YNY9_EUMVA|nr:hypothetical protein EVAR_50124_1 [Eumeta japonica]
MHEVEQLTSFETMRSIGIRDGSSDRKIRLFAAYRPPGTRMCVQDIYSIFNGPTSMLINRRRSMAIGEWDYEGEMAHWNFHSLDETQQKKVLLHVCILRKCSILPVEPAIFVVQPSCPQDG